MVSSASFLHLAKVSGQGQGMSLSDQLVQAPVQAPQTAINTSLFLTRENA